MVKWSIMSSTANDAQFSNHFNSPRLCGRRHQEYCARRPPATTPQQKPCSQEQPLLKAQQLENPHWEGKLLRVAVGQTTEKDQQMAVPFAVLNSAARTIQVLAPQIQLAGASRDKHRKAIKAEPVAIKDYWMTTRRLARGARADGLVVFERPSFKESRERLLLAVAQA
jgi:hypothetical protein